MDYDAPSPTSLDGDGYVRIRERFEAERRSGSDPRIEDYLDNVSGSERSDLLRVLIELEARLRTQSGDPPSQDEYFERFPNELLTIESAFEAAKLLETAAYTSRVVPPEAKPLETEASSSRLVAPGVPFEVSNRGDGIGLDAGKTTKNLDESPASEAGEETSPTSGSAFQRRPATRPASAAIP